MTEENNNGGTNADELELLQLQQKEAEAALIRQRRIQELTARLRAIEAESEALKSQTAPAADQPGPEGVYKAIAAGKGITLDEAPMHAPDVARMAKAHILRQIETKTGGMQLGKFEERMLEQYASELASFAVRRKQAPHVSITMFSGEINRAKGSLKALESRLSVQLSPFIDIG